MMTAASCPRCGGGPYVVRPIRVWVRSFREWTDRPKVCHRCGFGDDRGKSSTLIIVLLVVFLCLILLAMLGMMLAVLSGTIVVK